jgi:hypothetical protein
MQSGRIFIGSFAAMQCYHRTQLFRLRCGVLFACLIAATMAGAAAAEPCIADEAAGTYSAEHLLCLRQEADQGDFVSQYLLGVYQLGQGTLQDYDEAAKWLRRAADHGHSGAQFTLGEMYDLGVGVPKDFVRAHMWLSLSAAQNYPEAEEMRDDLAEYMTWTQIEEARLLAGEWKLARH